MSFRSKAGRPAIALACMAVLAAACGPRTPASQPSARLPAFTKADVAFMQGMIGHHAQAIEMVELLKTRTTRPEMLALGHRIEVSQNDEIRMMEAWLRDRKLDVPGAHAHHMMMSSGTLMPGMLTSEEMARLAGLKGTDFEKLFLELMIKHHQGALTMVKDLLSQPGAAQDSNVFHFATDVEADQSAEIQRMRLMRGAMGKSELGSQNLEVRSQKSEVRSKLGSGK